MIATVAEQASPSARAFEIGLVSLPPGGDASFRVIQLWQGGDSNSLWFRCDAGSVTLKEAPLERLDGIVAHGSGLGVAEVTTMPHWNDLVRLLDRAAAKDLPGLYIDWPSHALLLHRHGVRPSPLAQPIVGPVDQEILAPSSPFLAGLGRRVCLKVERHSKIRWASLASAPGLRALAAGARTGLSLIEEPASRSLMVLDRIALDVEPSSISGRLLRNWLGELPRSGRSEAA